MTVNNAAMGFERRYWFDAAGASFGGSSPRFELKSSTVKKLGEHLQGMGVTGTRTRREDRKRTGLVRVAGSLTFEPSYRVLDYFLPKFLGTAGSSGTFAVNDSLIPFDMVQSSFVGSDTRAEKFGELYVNKATLKFAAGLLELTLDVIGKTYTGAIATSGLTAVLGAGEEYKPMTFYESDGGFNLASNVIEVESGSLSIDNQLEVKFRNSQTAKMIRASDRIVMLETNIPTTTTTWDNYFGDKAAATAVITMGRTPSSGTALSSVVTLYNLSNPDEGGEQQNKQEIPLVLRAMARGDASNPDISWFNDPTN